MKNGGLTFGEYDDKSIKDASTEKLIATLCTDDGVGKENKEKILEIILERTRDETAWSISDC
jgi:hypothetical protein